MAGAGGGVAKVQAMKPPVYPGRILTVVIRDDGPMVVSGDTPTYRSARVMLTDEQVRMLELRWSGHGDLYEEISRCFIEPRGERRYDKNE